MNQSKKLIKDLSKEVKSNIFFYHKVRRAIIKWGAIEKSQILTKIILHFDCNNNIFADCIKY